MCQIKKFIINTKNTLPYITVVVKTVIHRYRFGGAGGMFLSIFKPFAIVSPNTNTKVAEDCYSDRIKDIYTKNRCRKTSNWCIKNHLNAEN